MSRAAASLLALVAGTAAALALVSCGGGDAKLLPGNTAQEIGENLDAVQRLAEEGECVDAEDAALEVSTQVETLSGIDPKLKEALRAGADRLNEVVDTCAETTADTAETTTAPDTTETTEGKSKKEKKPKKVKPEETEPTEEAETTKPPAEAESPQSDGEGGGEESAPAEEGGRSGGIGPGNETGSG